MQMTRPALRLAGFVGVLLAEILAVSLSFDALSIADTELASGLVAFGGYLLKACLVFAGLIILITAPRLPNHLTLLTSPNFHLRETLLCVTQLACFACLFVVSDRLFFPGGANDQLALLWVALVAATGATWLAAVARFSVWSKILSQEWRALLLAGGAAGLTLILAFSAQSAWAQLSEWTFAVSGVLLNSIYGNVLSDPETLLLGTTDFMVRIDEACSGYEGVGLISIFTALYLWIYRTEFSFPRALLLFPLGIAVIWLFNAIRIVLLIVIGHEISPAIAVGGFHSQAGWIMFIVVALAILVAADRSDWFASEAGPEQGQKARVVPLDPHSAGVWLLPLVVLLTMTLITSAFSGTVDWLYPLRVIGVGAAIMWVWSALALERPRFGLVPIAAGLGVFALWLLMVEPDPDRDAEMAQALAAVPSAWMIAWVMIRCLGAALMVPIAEELAFRGYLINRLRLWSESVNLKIDPRLLPLAVSTILFGLLHSAWIAGMLAGLVYGLVRYHKDSVTDAIIAHAITNALLSGYIIAFGVWSLW